MSDLPEAEARAVLIRTTFRGKAHLDAVELAAVAGLSLAALERLVKLGLIEPAAPGRAEFTAETAARLRRMLRLRSDLGVGIHGAAVIVDLLERMERLEAELMRLR
jgi:MerR family transcriptional regulator/heat shock protein HspR